MLKNHPESACTDTLLDVDNACHPDAAEQPALIGRVKPSRHSFGFLMLNDGTDVFLPPAQMMRCFHGDTVSAHVITNPDGRKEAKLVDLVASSVNTFYGKIRFREGKTCLIHESPEVRHTFDVECDAGMFLGNGDIVLAELKTHPIDSHFPIVKVLKTIANERDIQHPWKLASDRYGISPAPVVVLDQPSSGEDAQRVDMLDIPFVTIDGESTRDIDDALFAERTLAGYTLKVAIADPSSVILPGSEPDLHAQKVGFSCYFPGYSVPMLSVYVSEEFCSLNEDTPRNAVVCTLHYDHEGVLLNSVFQLAKIKSRRKLSYQLVDQMMDGHDVGVSPEVQQSIRTLDNLTALLSKRRKTFGGFFHQQPYYQIQLEGFEVKTIEVLESNSSQRLVEESMVAANLEFGSLMSASGASCLYRVNEGFKELQTSRLTSRLVELGLYEGEDLRTPKGFRSVMTKVKAASDPGIMMMVSSFISPTVHSTKPGPHLVMGVQNYATFTSPLRKYSDLLNHRSLKALLLNQDPVLITTETTIGLDDAAYRINAAARDVRKEVLLRHYKSKIGETETAVIKMAYSAGILLLMERSGLTVFIQASDLGKRHDQKKMSPDGMQLTVGDKVFRTGTKVSVQIDRVLFREGTLSLLFDPT